MPHVVTQSCCADASCVVACPVNCIHPAPGEPGFGTAEMLFVDPATCVGCSACVTACPVGAIKPDTTLTDAELPFLELNAQYYHRNPHEDRTPLALVPTQRRLRRPGPFRIAVIGAGPAGLYTADELLRHPEITTVDVYDRLRTPYGLVRHGVAPDHGSTKRVTELFAAIESQPGFRYRLGVDVGTDVTLAQLRSEYHGVVYAVGASHDRTLGIPGEHLAGSLGATDLVGWYNGHPDRRELTVPLHHERAVVIGNGNVALDVARMLTRDPQWLAEHTDIAPHALNQLRHSNIREVRILGRRGPANAAFTVPELLGLKQATHVDVVVDADPSTLTGTDRHTLILRELAERPTPTGTRPRIVLEFHAAPVEIIGDRRTVALEIARTGADGVPTGTTRVVDTGLVVRAIGFRGSGTTGLPTDPATGIARHDRGRVEPGLYVAGWVKRGPRGFIGTNKTCAQETVESILDDLDGTDTTDTPATPPTRGVGLDAWRRLDAAEIARGATEGRPRVKLTDPHEQARAQAPREAPRRKRAWGVVPA
ncbi:FAD-dependent oxidoreductase [Rhodococcoides corynebacterioides]|uniref:ferredoxin--NADP(+) reductase n=1 Tax=Rhodococcoides corynebacterioides TaxID=53972 RepID=A0ABS7P6R2_9NOCA|nr:FAD-dependent oxidoreductase [Rhodococcus corynebacterioides]MBY6368119.1 FAD-dependent oxidoreductase [Rhodococcus corynebacterioides]MBY6409604.1 FAD-dependent oxidoreductase [Rhodococcus corynebacterioides]